MGEAGDLPFTRCGVEFAATFRPGSGTGAPCACWPRSLTEPGRPKSG
jgi:hypothetical protein